MFEKASAIIRDGLVLDFAYIPKDLIHRELQMGRLETLFRPMALDGRSCTAFLSGSVGTGKTVTARRFCADMAAFMASKGRPTDVIYINCRNTNEAGTLVQLIRHYDKGFPERGFSVEEMARILSQHLVTNDRGLTIILDEVDVLFRKGSTDLVYQLTRPRDNQKAPVSLIMIAQGSIDMYLDEASRSSFRRSNGVRFDSYSAQELLEIVSSRAQEALYPGTYADDSLVMIADESAEFGDARMAIELLDRAANIAEEDDSGEITVEHVRAAKAMIYSSVSDSKLRMLDMNRMLVLLAVARAMKKNLSIPSSAVEKTYAIACEEYDYPSRKHTQFWTYLQDLDNLGILKLSSESGPSGKVTMVSLPDIPSKVLASKMEALLDRSGDDYDDLRSLQARSRYLRALQRHASLRRALHALRGPPREEGDPQADRCRSRRSDRGGRIWREGQHGGAQDAIIRIQWGQRRRGPCDHHRRGDRGLSSSERRYRQEILQG